MGVISAILRTGDSVTKKIKSGNARMGAWSPSHYRPTMIANSPPAFRSQMGVPIALPLAWGILARIGVPLLLTAGAIAGAGALVKSAVPSLPISKKNLGISALVGGAGMAAYFMSDVIPQAWRPVSYAAAAAGIAGSIYLLFTDVEEPPAAGDVTPTEAAVPGAYAQIAAVFESPREASTVGTGFLSQDYDVKISWVNRSRELVEFDHRLMIRKETSHVFGDQPEVTETVVPEPSKITLKPLQSLLRLYEIDAGPRLLGGWVASNIKITAQIFNPHTLSWINVGSTFFRVVRWA